MTSVVGASESITSSDDHSDASLIAGLQNTGGVGRQVRKHDVGKLYVQVLVAAAIVT